MMLAVVQVALVTCTAAAVGLVAFQARNRAWRAAARDWARRLLVEDPADVFNWWQRLWTWRRDVFAVLLVVAVLPFVALAIVDVPAGVFVAAVSWVGTGWWRQHIKRRFVKTCRFAKVEQVRADQGRDESSGEGAEHKKVVAREHHRTPRLQNVHRTDIGWAGQVRAPRGQDLGFLVKRRDAIAATLGVRAIHVDVHDDNPRIGDIVIVRDDPFPPDTPWAWPVLTAEPLEATSLWDAVPFGRDELGRQVDLPLPYSNFLLGGVPDAGKSASEALVLCWAALDPSVPLYIIDGAESDMAPFRPLIDRTGVGRYVGDDVVAAEQLLDELIEVIRHRQKLLAGDDVSLAALLEQDGEDGELGEVWRRKVARGDDEPLILFVCDEWGSLVDQLKPGPQRDRFNEKTRYVVSKGRKVGVVSVFSTQKPAHEVVPTSIRDLFRLRFALQSMTTAMSDMILGEWSQLGYNAATDIPPGHPGMGLLHATERLPQRVRSFYIDDAGIIAVCRRALELRTRYLEANGHSGLGLGLVGGSRARLRREPIGGVKGGQGVSGDRVVVGGDGSAEVVRPEGGGGHRSVRRGGGLPRGRRPL